MSVPLIAACANCAFKCLLFVLVVPLGRPQFLVSDDKLAEAFSSVILKELKSKSSDCSVKSETTDLLGFASMVTGNAFSLFFA
jgi:hypothetical protein